MKACSKCYEIKDLADFGSDAGREGGLNVWCKACVSANARRKRAENPELIKARERAYNAKNIARRRETTKRGVERFFAKNPGKKVEYFRRYHAKRRANDPTFRAICIIKSRVWGLLTDGPLMRTDSLLGYSRHELGAHLQALFVPGMNWDNYGAGEGRWHIDHIRPVASFKASDYSSETEMLSDAFRLNNLKPMWSHENISKGAEWQGHIWRGGKPIRAAKLAKSAKGRA